MLPVLPVLQGRECCFFQNEAMAPWTTPRVKAPQFGVAIDTTDTDFG